jgi:parallel beta-helix repeat protein
MVCRLYSALLISVAVFSEFGSYGGEGAIPGFVFQDGAYVPDAPYREGRPQATGLQLPFPAMPSLDTNPMTLDKVELGKLLYFDPVLSGPNTLSCATCHHPDHGFADGRQLGMGVGGRGIGPERSGGAVLKRHTPTVWNAAFSHLQFWDGRATDLEDQAGNPITAHDEMSQNPDVLETELREIPEYVERFQNVFGGTPEESVTFENVKKAIAAFERTIVSINSRFDRYTQGDMNALTEPEKRGLKLFRSVKTRCFECHRFPHFADDTFRVVGVPELEGHEPDVGRAEVPGQGPQFAFKVPTLRNVELTAPYMHNGVFATLEEVIDFYAKGGGRQFAEPVPGIDDKIGKFTLTDQEKSDLVAFLKSLTDTSLQPDPPAEVPSGFPVVTVLTKAMAPVPPVTLAANAAPNSDDARLTRTPTVVSDSSSAANQLSHLFAPAATAPAVNPEGSAPNAIFTVEPGQSIQAAIDRALPGDRVEVMPGVYHDELVVDKHGISLVGLNVRGERPILDGQGTMADAVNVSGSNFVIDGFVIRRYAGNGVTVSKATNVTCRNLTLIETGLYGVYPVECTGVLVEGCTVTGISDAGIYVGQSRDIVVRNNEAYKNVAGIEIENCVNAIVENNTCHNNAAGLLVFVLPNNPSKVGDNCRVVNNRIFDNNGPNFGKPGSIVESVPPGLGLLVMAADRTEITQNIIAGNNTYGIAVVGLGSSPASQDFASHALDVEPNSDFTLIHGNQIANNGANPSDRFRSAFPDLPGGDILWDGTGEGNEFREAAGLKTMPPDLLRDVGQKMASTE